MQWDVTNGVAIRSRCVAKPLTALILGLAGLLLGCGGSGGEGEGKPSGPQPEPITYEIAGGFPPFVERLHIGVAGQARLSVAGPRKAAYSRSEAASAVEVLGKRRESFFQVPAARLVVLRAQLEGADLANLHDSDVSCNDCPLIRLRYGGARFEAGSMAVPTELEKAMRMLHGLVEKHADDPLPRE